VEARRKNGAEYPPKNFIVVSKVHLFWRIKFLNLKLVIFNFRVNIFVEQNELYIVLNKGNNRSTKHKVKQQKVTDCIVMHGKTGTVTGDTVSYCSHDINLSSTPCMSLTVSNLQYNEHQRKYSKSFHKRYIFVSIDLLNRLIKTKTGDTFVIYLHILDIEFLTPFSTTVHTPVHLRLYCGRVCYNLYI
jgi:hypothetical protein